MNQNDKIGKYEIVRVIGEGGMGRVYEATDPVIGRRVAVKVISLAVDTPQTRARFFREAQAAGRLSHPNIITIHDIGGQADESPFIVMEFLEGTDLSHALAGGALPIEKKIQIAIDICDGLEHAHDHGIIHRDIKPANVFITAQGHAKIVDFGLARGEASDLTHTGTILGTPNYMAPEQIMGEAIDQRADIFAVGVVLYELFSNQKPFAADSVAATIYKVLHTEPPPVHTLDTALPPALSNVIQRAIAKDRTKRYQRVRDLRDELVAMWMGRRTEPVDVSAFTVQVPATSPGATAARHDRRLWIAGGLAAVIVVASAATLIKRAGTPTPPVTFSAGSTPPAAAAGGAVPPVPERPTQALEPRPAESTPTAAPPSAPARSAPPRADSARGNAAPVEPRSADRPRVDPPRAVTGSPAAQPSAPSGMPPDIPAAASASPARDQPQQPSAVPAPAIAAPLPPVVLPPVPEPRAEARRPAPEPPAAPAPPVAAAPRAEPEHNSREASAAAIQRVISEYRGALESRDLGALKRIWPALGGRQESAIRSEFENTRAIRVALSDVQTTIAGATATVSCRRNYAVTTADGQRLDTSSKMTMTLSSRDGAWLIDNIRFEAAQ